MNGNAVCFDAYYALTVKGAPGTLAFLASNGEITAANDAGRFESVASAFDFLCVPGVELQGTDGPVNLAEFHGDDAAASALNEALDEGSLVSSDEGAHGKKKKRGSRLGEGTIA